MIVTFEVGDAVHQHQYPADHTWNNEGRFLAIRNAQAKTVAFYMPDRVICVRAADVPAALA